MKIFAHRLPFAVALLLIGVFQGEEVIVSAEICDISGRRIATFSGRFVWRPDNLPAGVYLLKVGTSSGFARKVIYLK